MPAGERNLEVIRPVVNYAAVHDGVGHVGGIFERIAVVEHDIADFSHLQTTVLSLNAQDLGRIERDRSQGAVVPEAVDHGDRRFMSDYAGLGYVGFVAVPMLRSTFLSASMAALARQL